jgi:16S rRNA (uracil1498-N3)-methyltransferase
VTLRRIHLPPERIDGARGMLGPEARRYLADVLRLAPGARLEVFDGKGGRYSAEIVPGFEWVALGPREAAPASSVELALLVALAKGEKMDLVVQKATELGVARVLPFEAERSVVRLEPEKGEERAGRWRRIAAEAARQCGRADVPEVAPPASLGRALAALAPGTRIFVFHPPDPYAPPAPSPAGARTPAAASFAAVVGPEGGLTAAEVGACEAAGAERAGLGPRVLRAETAAIVAVALLQARHGDLA